MDSQDRDESKIRRREETLARRMGEALEQMNLHGSAECPDAEVLAAYAEQALGPAELAQWEGHFATCARCRKILRVLAASGDKLLAEKEAAHLGELVSAVRAPVEIAAIPVGRSRQKLVDWRARWLAPALGVAAVLVVWFVMRPPWRATDRGATATLVAQAPKQETPLNAAPTAEDRLSQVAPVQDQKAKPAPLADRSAAKTASLDSAAGAPAGLRAEAGNEIKKISPSGGAGGGALQKEKKFDSLSEGQGTGAAASPAPPPPPQQAKAAPAAPAPAALPQARAQSDAATAPAPEVPSSTSQSVAVTEAVPLVETTNGTLGGTIQPESSTNMPLNGRNYAPLVATRGISPLLKAPSGSTLWRAGKGGMIERTTNAGTKWISQKSPSREEWLGGAAVSDTVCWLVGRNGAIARTVDGKRWERVAPPAQAVAGAAKLPDLTGVAASDALKATITAADGRRFATLDGGKTWQLQ
jgi:hypothetical protein